MEITRKRKISLIVLVASVLVFGGWGFVISPAIDKGQVYEGTVVEKVTKSKWGHWFDQSNQYKRRYLVIQTQQGKRVHARVPQHVYRDFEVGDAAIKVKGERYPKPALGQGRHISTGELFDALKQRDQEP
ncbi:MAG: hypothetical protein P9M14_18380 [Candidatus Alcyoniella australis]|nr:hypothetical protein [Candidatus Alcyoniella australis]